MEIALFTPPEEVRTGADWYWRFERGDRAIHARVQAKRVQRADYDQADNNGHIDINLPQLERLLQATKEAVTNIPGLEAWIATYARFDATPPCGSRDLQTCPHHNHTAACVEHVPSLWIAHAQKIKGAIGRDPRRIPVATIIEHSLRLDCILPCIDGGNADSGPARKGFTTESGLRPYQECVATIEGDTLLRNKFEGALRIVV